MFFLLMSIIIAELKYNGEVRKFNRAMERLRQKYEKFEKEKYEKLEKENWEIIQKYEKLEKENWEIIKSSECIEETSE